MKLLLNKYLLFALRLVIGGVFVYASLDKITHPDQFARIIYNYHMMPGSLINIFALVLPWLELISGLLLIVGYWEKAAAVITGGMLAVFAAALATVLIRGVNIECGCFSTTSRAKAPVINLLIRDLLMLVGCLMILAGRERFLALERATKTE